MAENNENNQNRQPRNLQGLLNFCTEITAREDTTQPTARSQMDPERLRFLEEALSELTTGVAKRMAENIRSLCSEAVTMPGEDVTEQEEALETLEEYAEDLNYAIDLHKIGGFPVMVSCLDSPHANIRAGAASLIGGICQNMEYCQTQMLELNTLLKLIHMLENDQVEKCKIKALYAISCLIRDFPEGEKQFEKNDGFSVLMRAIQTGVEKLIVKSVFLLTSLIKEYDSRKDTVISMGYIEQLLGILNCESSDNITREHCSSALLHLASSYPPALSECKRPELHMRSTLSERTAVIQTMEECKEENEYIRELLKLLDTNEDEYDNRMKLYLEHREVQKQLVLVENNEDDDLEDKVELYEEPHASSAKAKSTDMSKVFIPTHEWQEVREDHVILPGLHYQMNMETGKKQAKLTDGDDGSKYMAAVDRFRRRAL